MRRIWMFAFLMRIHLMTLHEVREETAVFSIQTDKDRAEKRKWLRHCPAVSNVGSSARSFKMIGILREKKTPVLKVKK